MSEDQYTGLLGEHEPSQEATSGHAEAYNPDEEERKTIKLVNKTFEKNKRHRKKYDHKWLDNYKFFRGKQWKDQRPSYRHSEVINMVFQNIQSVVPIMTDSRPKVEFSPREPGDMELAQILNDVFESDWERGNWLQELTAGIYDSHFYGHGMYGVEYDDDADFGAGDITFESSDVFHHYPDPNATDVNKKSRNHVIAEPIDIAEAKAEYPEKSKYFKADLIDLLGGDKTALEQIRYKSPIDNRVTVEGEEAPDTETSDQCLKITLYCKSDESYEEEGQEADEQTGEMKKIFTTKLKYPNGRKIVVISGVLCEDGPMPYDDKKFPFAKLTNYILPREYYGISEVEQLEGPQKTFNKLVSFALDVLTLMGNPIWIVDNDSEVDTDNLFNRPGLVVEKSKGSEVRREEGVQLQPYVLQLIDRMKSWFDGVSGSTDVSRGVRPEGITAASAISELQDAAQTRIRLKSRNLDACLRDIGSLWVSRCFQFNTAPKVYRITQNENAQKYFKMYVNKTEDGQKIVSVRGYTQDPMSGQMVEDAQAKEYQVKGEFDVKVTTGSSLPFAKTQKIQLATTLFDRGAIDELELLKAADYPNYQSVYDQVMQRKQQQAQMQAQAQAAGQPPQGAPPAA